MAFFRKGDGSSIASAGSSSNLASSAFANLKNVKRRAKAQLATFMGAEETKDERVDGLLDQFHEKSTEVLALQKEMRKMGDSMIRFYTLVGECEVLKRAAPDVHHLLSGKGSSMMIAAVLDEKVHGVIEATLVHIRTIEASVKDRKDQVLDYDHQRRQHAKLVEKADSLQGDADKHAEAMRTAEDRGQKVQLAKAKMESTTNALVRELERYNRAHAYIIQGVTDTVAGIHRFYCEDDANMGGVRKPSSPPPPGAGLRDSQEGDTRLSVSVESVRASRAANNDMVVNRLRSASGTQATPQAKLDPRSAQAAGTTTVVNALETAEQDLARRENARVFGKDIASLEPELPHIIDMIGYLESDPANVTMEGIFRTSGDSSVMSQLKEKLDRAGLQKPRPAFLKLVQATKAGVPEVAAVLKLYFRDLPTPLLPSSFYKALTSEDLSDDYAFVEKAQAALAELNPNAQKATRLLLVCLARVRESAEKNLMDAKNLGVCFAPTLVELPQVPGSASADFSSLRGAIDLIARLVTFTPALYDPEHLYDDYPFPE